MFVEDKDNCQIYDSKLKIQIFRGTNYRFSEEKNPVRMTREEFSLS
jgi:hypothetical protein